MIRYWKDKLGWGWRSNLMKERWFYFVTLQNWRAVTRTRLYREPLSEFVFRGNTRVRFEGLPPLQILNEVWRAKHYTPPESTDLYPQTVVDIGANIGLFTLFAARQWRNATILAFEPEPRNFVQLQENVRLSNVTNVSCHRAAISSRTGSETLYIKQEAGWHSFFGDDLSGTLTVETLSLRDLLQRFELKTIDFLKMDCEGAEFLILPGQEDLLANYVRFIAMEYHEISGHRVQELELPLRRAGMTVRIIPQPRWSTGMLYAKNPNLK